MCPGQCRQHTSYYTVSCDKFLPPRMPAATTPWGRAPTTKKTVGPLPDPTTCSRIAREMKELSKYQRNEELSCAKSTTVKYDGTSKKKTHYVEVQVATTKKILTTGLFLMASGTAEAYTNTVMQSVQDFGAAGMVITGRDTTAQILGEISNTMTDRHIVNKKANELLYMENLKQFLP